MFKVKDEFTSSILLENLNGERIFGDTLNSNVKTSLAFQLSSRMGTPW
jgi:hypothetical protein